MESEFLKDLDDLKVAFKMHVDEKEDERSIIVIGQDGGTTHAYFYGKPYILGNSMLNAMMKCEERGWMNAVVHLYEQMALTHREALFLIFGWVIRLFVIVWGVAIIVLWYFYNLPDTTTITNLLLVAYTFFYIHWTSAPVWKKAKKSRKMRKGE